MARCDLCVRAFQAPGRGTCPLGRDLQAERATRGEHECSAYRPLDLIGKTRKEGLKTAPQEGLF